MNYLTIPCQTKILYEKNVDLFVAYTWHLCAGADCRRRGGQRKRKCQCERGDSGFHHALRYWLYRLSRNSFAKIRHGYVGRCNILRRGDVQVAARQTIYLANTGVACKAYARKRRRQTQNRSRKSDCQ